MRIFRNIRPHVGWLELCLFTSLWIVTASYLIWQNQPHLPAWKMLASKYECLSYAPYYQPGQTPQLPSMYISKQQIESDLQRLSQFTNCVRTYSVGQGLDVVPEVAHGLGMQVKLGAWVSWTDADNRKEIALAIRKANAYPETVTTIIIGNEVLLRREQSESAMRGYLQWAQAHTNIPITYADVWEFWLRHPGLEQVVDRVTVHILPYWEDAPVAIEHAAAHTEAVMQKLTGHFKKPIYIGETGWPSAGRQRFGATPSAINQVHYLRTFLDKANQHGWHYNIIEAIDQPWKRDIEGTVGGYWGILNAQLKPKFDIEQPQPARKDGWVPWLCSLGAGVLFWGVLGVKFAGSHDGNRWQAWRLGMIGAVLGLAGYWQWEYWQMTSRNLLEMWWLGGLALLANAMCVYCACNRASWSSFVLKVGMALLVISMLGFSVMSLIDGRYRDFNTPLYLLPVAILVIDGLCAKGRVTGDSTGLDGVTKLGLLCGVMALLVCLGVCLAEPANTSAWLWMLTVAVLTFSAGLLQQATRLHSH